MALRALVATDLSCTLGSRRVLDGISLTAAPGDRIGLIGENGAGKTTLLRLLAGQQEADAGTIERPPDLGFVQQEVPFSASTTVQQVVDAPSCSTSPPTISTTPLLTFSRRNCASSAASSFADELQDAIDDAAGAVVVASHDRWLRRRWRGSRLELTTSGPG